MMREKIRYLFIPLLVFSIVETILIIIVILFNIQSIPLWNTDIASITYPFSISTIIFEMILLYLADFEISIATIIIWLVLIANLLLYIILVFFSIKRGEETRKNASGVIILLTCIDLLTGCVFSLNNLLIFILALALRGLIIYSCAINIKLINDF